MNLPLFQVKYRRITFRVDPFDFTSFIPIQSDQITNFSAEDKRRIDLVIGVGYDDDIPRAKALIQGVLSQEDRILDDAAVDEPAVQPLGLDVVFLSGGQKAAHRRHSLAAIESGLATLAVDWSGAEAGYIFRAGDDPAVLKRTGSSLPKADPLHKVTIIPRGRALGVTQQLPVDDRHTYSRDYLQATIAVLMAGRVA